jgi:hypothetical protein
MLTGEAQNLMVSEKYVALFAHPGAGTPYADSRFSPYPAGEEPEYFKGVDPYVFKARNDYGQLYFYLGSIRFVNHYGLERYGLCTSDGKIVTEHVFTAPMLLIDNKGNKAYLCYRTDKEPLNEMVEDWIWTNNESRYPVLLFALDGSWIKEFDGAAVSRYGFRWTVDLSVYKDVLAVKLGGKWGAVNIKGEMVIPIDRDSADGIYPSPDNNVDNPFLCVTDDRYILTSDYGALQQGLYDADMNLITKEVRGFPQGMPGDFIVTIEWDEQNSQSVIHTYTIDGEPLASLAGYSYATSMGDFVWVDTEKSALIFDKELHIIYEFPFAFGVYANATYPGPNVIFQGSSHTYLHRTYLPDGTRLMTWYDMDA